jgi:RimJ/RimL family protein N-acetyltransferase
MKLETGRLIIRPIKPEDKNELFEYRSDAETNKYQGWVPKSIADVELFIDGVSKHPDEPETWFQVVLIEKESQKLIGDVGIHFFGEENKQAEIGFTLSKAYQKKGYAKESVERIIDYLFEDLNKHRIIASTDPQNENSIGLLEKIGFRKEAHFIKSLFLNDHWVDDVVYAMIEDDWRR